MSIKEELEAALHQVSPTDEASKVSYFIWGAAVTTTRAFENVQLRVDPDSNRVFVKVKLRWFAKSAKFKMLHNAWLARAERRCREHLPEGWKLLIYYVDKMEGKKK